MPAPNQPEIVTLLDRMQALIDQLREERWNDYDKTLRAACTAITRTALSTLAKVAKAISKVTPEETVRQPADAQWWTDTLDNMK